jgi:hypothetical protein
MNTYTTIKGRAAFGPILLVLLVSLVLGCAGMAAAANGQFPDSQYLTAEGSGSSAGEARNQAMAELSRIFESKVRSEAMDYVASSIDASGRETSEQSIQSKIRVVSAVELQGVEIGSEWTKNGTYHALAILNRQKAAALWQTAIDDVDAKIQGHLAVQAGTLARFRALKAASDLWIERAVLVSRMTVIGIRPSEPAYDMKAVYRELPQMKQTLAIYVEIYGAEQYQARRQVADGLGKAGYTITDRMDRAAIIVRGRIDALPVAMNTPNFVYARAVVELQVVDARMNEVVREVSFDLRSSQLTFDEAARRAIKKIVPDVAAKIIEALEE